MKRIAEIIFDCAYQRCIRLFVKGFITEQQYMHKMRFWRDVFYPKWVLGECHHLCCFCEYKQDCFGNLD